MNRMSAKGIVEELRGMARDWRRSAKNTSDDKRDNFEGRAVGLSIAADLIVERFDIQEGKKGR
ncbi:MAG: hypothetical protein K0U16_07605 [Gammaproteobacteria bacterium]|nr:hypothetical protein [Gammaproteobacteria bacterium]